MINISDKEWKQLTVEDIEKAIKSEEESFFFEFKDDQASTKKIAEEISALANTYGGYIFLGVTDEKEIRGCMQWTEQKIHTMIHDALSPTPEFDVKRFVTADNKIILVIKIEEGTEPPYITSRGEIYERISSGSFKINDSAKLNQMYYRKEKFLNQIEKKLEIPPVKCEKNLFGYLDIGFSLRFSDHSILPEKFIHANLRQIAYDLQKTGNIYTVSQVGISYVFSVGDVTNSENIVEANLHNFMEIMSDGSVKMRVLLTNNENEPEINIGSIMSVLSIFSNIYSKIFGKDFEEYFIGAYKYEELTVEKQFTTFLQFDGEEGHRDDGEWEDFQSRYVERYGNNRIISGNRIPKSGLYFLDKRHFNQRDIELTGGNIIEELFRSNFSFVGYILGDE